MALFIKKNGSLQQVAIGHKILKPEQSKSVTLDLASGDQTVTPDANKVLSQVLIEKPDTLISGNIKNGVTIAGVQGNYITPNESQTVTLDLELGDQVVNPSAAGMLINQVTITKPATLVKGNIKDGINIGGITGTYKDYLVYRISNQGNYSYTNNDITEIKSYAFSRDANITSFSSTSVTKIKNSAFEYSGLTSINCPNFTCDTTTEAGQCSANFQNCSSLTTVSFPLLKVAPQNMFYYCTSLASVNLPELTTINGGFTFYHCTSLQTISLPKLETPVQLEFYDCTQLSSVSLPKLKFTSSSMFSNCTSLTNISFTSAFVGNTSNNRAAIGSSCFQGCTNLTSVSGSEYITQGYVASSAFKNCSSLTTINLGNSAKIEYDVFYNCTSLTDVTLSKSDSICTLGNISAFANIGHQVTIHVPQSLISTYQSASNWTTLYNDSKITFVAIS